jgi:hypothetical protein
MNMVFDVRGNTKGLGGLLHNFVERGNKQSSRIKDQSLEPSQGRQKGKAKERPKDN